MEFTNTPRHHPIATEFPQSDCMSSVAVSVVIPAYNTGSDLVKTVESICSQSIDSSFVQIIVVNDGSTDETQELANNLAATHANITAIHTENRGVSAARNTGIKHAIGRYIAFVDSDDTIEADTLEGAVSFFDAHYEDIDVVTYPMILYDKYKKWHHAREEIFNGSGIYDLNELKNAFLLINTVNVLVKNNDDLPRFDENLTVHEDEQFLLNILLRKLKVGFSQQGGYLYQQRPDSKTFTKMHPYYQFEKVMAFWEELFSRYESNPPLYLQADFLNELNWKTKQDLVYPYHYSDDEFSKAKQRIAALMDKIDDDIISTAPRMDDYLKCYFAAMRPSKQIAASVSAAGVAIHCNGRILLFAQKADAQFVYTRFDNEGNFTVRGILMSVIFFDGRKPELILRCTDTNNTTNDVPLELRPSSFSRHLSHIRTTYSWQFEFSVPCHTYRSIELRLHVEDATIPLQFKFSQYAQFNWANRLLQVGHGDLRVSVAPRQQTFFFSDDFNSPDVLKDRQNTEQQLSKTNKRAYLIRKLTQLPKRAPIWLYSDRDGVGDDNAYYQFLHDYTIQDGVERYYIIGDIDSKKLDRFDADARKRLVHFGSQKHKYLALRTDKFIVSYIEKGNWLPYTAKAAAALADCFNFELVYLQHGILHAHTPWKYSADRLIPARVVVSSQFEYDNFVNNYGYFPNQLIKSGMPRYDFISYQPDTTKPRRILYAPSWRKYLVEELPQVQFGPKLASFLESSFWKETAALMQDKFFLNMLDKKDCYFDIKLHPIMTIYKDQFSALESSRVHLVESVNKNDYSLLLTDYSSLVFDFVYQKCPILYYFPDINEFKSGLNGYHKLDYPLEQGFGPIVSTAEQCIQTLNELTQAWTTDDLYMSRMDGFFLHYDSQQRERLYTALMER